MRHTFDVGLAQMYGIEASIILCQFEFWITKNKENNKNCHEGKYWTYNSTKELAKYFPYMTERQINYTIAKLKQEDLIETGSFNRLPLDRTIWYTLTDKGFTILQNCKMQFTNLSNGTDKIVKSENNTDNINNSFITNHTQILPESNKKHVHARENSAPKLEDVKKFAKANSLLTIALKFFDYYEASNWLDKDGKPFNWKQKLLSWGNSEGMNVCNAQPVERKRNFTQREYKDVSLNDLFQSLDEFEF